MSNELSKLFVVIGAKTDEFKSGLDKMKEQVTGFTGTLDKAMGGLLPAATVAGVAYGFKEIMVKAAEYGETVGLAAEKTGLTTDFIQKLKFASDTSGTSLNALTMGIKRMSTVMADAFKGDQGAVQAIESLGISVADLLKMNPDQRVMAIFQAVSMIEDPTIKSAAAVQFLGRSGPELIRSSTVLKDW
jgi:hypothetical protein